MKSKKGKYIIVVLIIAVIIFMIYKIINNKKNNSITPVVEVSETETKTVKSGMQHNVKREDISKVQVDRTKESPVNTMNTVLQQANQSLIDKPLISQTIQELRR